MADLIDALDDARKTILSATWELQIMGTHMHGRWLAPNVIAFEPRQPRAGDLERLRASGWPESLVELVARTFHLTDLQKSDDK